jgi:hypothetical protein
MLGYIVNPRRALRAPARCPAHVVAVGAAFHGVTEDVGARGCQVVSPGPVPPEERVRIRLEGASRTLEVKGRVAWVSERAPWRVGIAFDDREVPECSRWMERLLDANPALAPVARVPARIALDWTVFLAPPPRLVVDFSEDEVILLRAIASGARVDELHARLRPRWEALQRALFSLLARQAVTFSRGAAVNPDAWRRILADHEAAFAAAALGRPPPSYPAQPAEAPERAAAEGASRPAGAAAASPPRWGAPLPAAGAEGERPGAAGGSPRREAAPALRRPPPPWGRPQEAQQSYERALQEVEAGRPSGAVPHLRRALALAPGDAEIAGTLLGLLSRDAGR